MNYSPESESQQEEFLSETQRVRLETLISRFGEPNDGGMIFIRTGTKIPESGPGGFRGEETPMLRPDVEQSIWDAKKDGIIVHITDYRDPQLGDSGEAIQIPSGYDPEGGILVELSQAAIDYVESMKK